MARGKWAAGPAMSIGHDEQYGFCLPLPAPLQPSSASSFTPLLAPTPNPNPFLLGEASQWCLSCVPTSVLLRAPGLQLLVLSFPCEWFCHPCQKSFHDICEGLFLNSWFYSLVYLLDFMPIPHRIGHFNFVLFWDQGFCVLQLRSSFQDCFGYSKCLQIHYGF